jgi:hypothetical protein
MIEHISLYRVKGVGGVGKPSCGKRRFDLAQKRVEIRFACKLNRNASLVVRRVCRRRAKLAHAQPSQPGERCPSQLIDHGWLLLRSRKTKKTAKATAKTINKPIESASKKVRQPCAPEESPRRSASRQFRK